MKQIDNGIRIVFLGDSLVNGACDETMLGWCGRLCEEAVRKGHNITYYNLGVRGDTSQDVRLRWELEVSRRLPKNEDCRLVLSLGINDVSLDDGKQQISTAESIANTTAILKEAGKYYEMMMVGPPPVVDEATAIRIKKLSMCLNDLCKDIGVCYIDIYRPLVENTIYLKDLTKRDGVHPSAIGYSEIARVINASGFWWY
ncbi:hypothetical protein JYT87_01920 [Nitrospira defluvii]|nr:hypothetical protein [Nitrospira defluvii]